MALGFYKIKVIFHDQVLYVDNDYLMYKVEFMDVVNAFQIIAMHLRLPFFQPRKTMDYSATPDIFLYSANAVRFKQMSTANQTSCRSRFFLYDMANQPFRLPLTKLTKPKSYDAAPNMQYHGNPIHLNIVLTECYWLLRKLQHTFADRESKRGVAYNTVIETIIT